MSHGTMASKATGWKRMVGPASILTTLLFLSVVFAPILETRISFMSYNDIVLARVAYGLFFFFVDKFLFFIVFVFGMVVPACKMIASIYCWYRVRLPNVRRYNERLSVLAKFSMLDIMLLAVFIVAFKGIGIGIVHIKYGLYIYAMLILTSFIINLIVAAVAKGLNQTDKEEGWSN